MNFPLLRFQICREKNTPTQVRVCENASKKKRENKGL